MNTELSACVVGVDIHRPYDALVVGGGPAGLATAIALSRRGRRVLVVERSSYAAARVGEHLPPDAIGLLAELGVRQILNDTAHIQSSGVQSAWGSVQPIEHDYFFHPFGVGFNLARPAFDRALADAAKDAGAAVLLGTKLNRFDWTDGGWSIELGYGSSSQCCQTSYLVDATGRAAAIATKLGARRSIIDQLIGIAVFCRVADSRHDTLVEAQEQCWWYSARLANDAAVATCMTDSDLLLSASMTPLEFWMESLAETAITKHRVRTDEVFDCHVRSAQSGSLDPVGGPGWIAVGDAAVSFDPLSSMGISKGIASGIRAAHTIEQVLSGYHGSMNDYVRDISVEFAEFLSLRAEYYQMERRWPNAELWRRRQLAAR